MATVIEAHPLYCKKHQTIKCEMCRVLKDIDNLTKEARKNSAEYKRAIEKLSKKDRKALGL